LHEYVLGSISEFKFKENKKLLAKYVFPNLLKDKLKFGKKIKHCTIGFNRVGFVMIMHKSFVQFEYKKYQKEKFG